MTTTDNSRADALTIRDGAENFACYLIDRCERETVTEENVQAWLGAMLKLPRYAAPQPAQADARGGLTDEQREAIDFVIGWYEQSTIADNPYREHIAVLRALLATPLPEPRAEVTEGMTMPPELGACMQCRTVMRYGDMSWGMCKTCGDAARTGASS